MPTDEQIKKLKENWVADPCWDIENTPGFDDVQAALLAFRQEHERKEEERYAAELRTYAAMIGLDSNLRLAAHIRELEKRVSWLETSRENNL